MNSNHCILVVEAEHDFRQLTAEALMEAGYQVETAYDEAGAWAALVSGIELLKKIHTSGVALPIIMTTGFSMIAEFARHPYLQPVKLIFKPCSFEKLLIMVRHSLSESVSTQDKY